jgi:transposase
LGSKHHLLTEATGLPLAITLTGGNRNDITQLLPLLDGVKPIRGRRGRPRKRPSQVIADRGYDHDKYRREVWRVGIKPVIARRETEHGSGLGVYRWVVERTFGWLHQSVDCAPATSATPPCTRPSCTSVARSSAGAGSLPHHCETGS